ncbi:MAG TPA: Mur ligase domain-containing protein, partial [Bacillota bacterium]|nr:Mur ligase domain-containing protein [Bacillota bacterium]
MQKANNDTIMHLLYDSRRLQQPAVSLFFALKTSHNDGHRFIGDAYKKGVRNFIVCTPEINTNQFTNCNVIFVDDSMSALQ